MSDLYSAQAGTLIKSGVSNPSFLTVDGLDDLLKGGKMLATSFRLDRGQDVQLLKTLSNLYYVYAFGEAPGKILIGGLLFFADCNSPGGNSSVVQDINSYYEQNNAYNKDGVIRIAAGGASYSGILTNLSMAADMTPYNYASFSLAFILIPPTS